MAAKDTIDGHDGQVRTVPPWVADPEEADEIDYLLPQSPREAHQAEHNHMPTPKHNAPKGRKFDHLRDRTPIVLRAPIVQTGPAWGDFTRPTPGQDLGIADSYVADEKWWNENMPTYEGPSNVRSQQAEEQIPGFWLFTPEKRVQSVSRFRRTLMRNPFVPLTARLIVTTFSCLALGLAANIWLRVSHVSGCNRGSSTYMAIVVDTVAIAYTLWITYDEYTAPPIGLRSPVAKMRIILLDLFFIIFDSANLSIAFQYLTDPNWACQNMDLQGQQGADMDQCPRDDKICDRQKALVATLLIALVAWYMTFTISMFRLVDKMIAAR